MTAEGVLILAGSFLAALALTWVIFERVLPLSGALGFWICTALMTLLIYAIAGWWFWSTRSVVVPR